MGSGGLNNIFLSDLMGTGMGIANFAAFMWLRRVGLSAVHNGVHKEASSIAGPYSPEYLQQLNTGNVHSAIAGFQYALFDKKLKVCCCGCVF